MFDLSLISSCDFEYEYLKSKGWFLVTQSHVKYHMIYQISIKMYRYTYRIDQTERYGTLFFTPQPSGLEGYYRHSPAGRVAARLAEPISL